jgi:hypothetical protein
MSDFRIDQITNQSGSRGPNIAGITTFSGSSGMLMPSGVTEYRGGRGRGLFGGGFVGPNTRYNTIEYITISTQSNAFDFGDLTEESDRGGCCASSVRGLFQSGVKSPGSSTNTISYVTISSTGNAFDFGDISTISNRFTGSSCSNNTRGLYSGGYNPVLQTQIDLSIIASLGNTISFGDLTVARRNVSSLASPTRGV